MTRLLLPALLLLTLNPAGPAQAQGAVGVVETAPAVASPAPYDAQLGKLSEILGAVAYLRNLCRDSSEPQWRKAMQDLIATETASEPARQEQLVAAFNRGYRAFASVHSACTASARAAGERYRNEGATLVTEITTRFGN